MHTVLWLFVNMSFSVAHQTKTIKSILKKRNRGKDTENHNSNKHITFAENPIVTPIQIENDRSDIIPTEAQWDYMIENRERGFADEDLDLVEEIKWKNVWGVEKTNLEKIAECALKRFPACENLLKKIRPRKL